MKEKEKPPGKKKRLNEIEASNLLDIKFKIMVINILRELKKNYRELRWGYYINIKKGHKKYK